MSLIPFSSKKLPGTSPGTVTFVGQKKVEKVRISLIRYSEEFFEELEFDSIEDCLKHRDSDGIKWINIDGLHDTNLIKTIGQAFNIHDLILEDVTNPHQRAKVDEFENHIFTVLKAFYLNQENAEILTEQMSFILGQDYVISFQERIGDVFEQIRQRLRTGGKSGRIRKAGPDYLLYSLLDAIVDHSFLALDHIGATLDSLDEELTLNPTPDTLKKINHHKQKILLYKKMIWPQREMFSTLQKTDFDLFSDTTRLFLRDVYDHVVQILDILEGFREMLSGMLDMYQSAMGNRLNEVMKVLTIIATLFIPPTFVAGIYGMNFEKMPELHTNYGYFIVLGVMATSIVSMLIYFRKKGWL